MNKLKSIYIHFPFCRHLCNYCDFFKSVSDNLDEDRKKFHDKFEEMFFIHQKLMSENNYVWSVLETIYIGGGTPSLWGEEGAFFFKEFLKKHNLKFAPNCEFTLEVNPGSWDEKSLNGWQEAGVNRFSLGIQSLDERFIKLLDRVHNLQDVFDTLTQFNKMGVNFSVDFMLGLPESEKYQRDVIKELETILTYKPKHISLYILTTKSNYIHNDKLPSEEWVEKEFLQVSSFLTQKGFHHYEVSNFAESGFESKHNFKYWESASTAALGPSATGLLSEAKIRYKWKPHKLEYEIEELTEDNFLLEKVYMALRTNKGFDFSEFPNDKVRKVFKLWNEHGYGKNNGSSYTLNSKGYLLLDSLINQLFIEKVL